MENLTKLHKAQLASDRMSCHSAIRCGSAPHCRILADAGSRSPAASSRRSLVKTRARVIEHIARIRVQLPTNRPGGARFRAVAPGLVPAPLSHGAACPDDPPTSRSILNALHSEIHRFDVTLLRGKVTLLRRKP
jgi:hypothetical protein